MKTYKVCGQSTDIGKFIQYAIAQNVWEAIEYVMSCAWPGESIEIVGVTA